MSNRLWEPDLTPISDDALVGRIADMTYRGRAPCAPESLELLGSLSRKILKDPGLRRAPQYVALAYWLRPAALSRFVAELTSTDRAGLHRAPRGVTLHLPPTNVDTIFVYSWAMSVLAGNPNVVRLAENLSEDTRWLVETTAQTVAEQGASDRHIFCHYGYGSAIERSIASHCDLRLIWGGDAKVDAVSRIPIRPDGLSIGFPDRKSLAAISSTAYAAATEAERDALATNFFNDLFWFDQMGCGSPRLLVWLGEPAGLDADFYRRVVRIVGSRDYNVETGVAIGKFAAANDLLAGDLASSTTGFGNMLRVNRMRDPLAPLSHLESQGGGFLCDWVAGTIADIPPLLSRRVQTITYFGLSESDRMALAGAIVGRGGYRIVPIGEALQFDVVWDGIDLLEHMTRKIVIR